jgi:hypothetical protein
MIRTSVALAAALLVTGSFQVWAQDDLGRILERDKIAAQKLQADVNHALAQARVLEPGRAVDLLQDTLAKVRNASELPADERARLVQRLQARIREVTSAAAQEKARTDDEAARRAEQRIRREARERDSGGVRSNPVPTQGPAGVASKIYADRTAALSSVDRGKAERNAANLDALTSMQRSATIMAGDIQFPKNWDKISERGKQKLTEKEITMLRALNSTMSADFDKMKLSKVIDLIQDKAGLTILVDEQSLRDANVDLYEDTVNFKSGKVSVRTILKKVLADRGLTYVLKDGMVQVVTNDKARQMMVVRAYPIGDLVTPNDQMFWGPIFSRAFLLQNAQRMIDMITHSVEPSQWNSSGGPGSITFDEASRSLVIRASAEMHYMLGGSGMVSR